MGGDAQADSTKRDASGSHSGARNCRRGRPVRHHPVGGTVARDGSPNGGLIVASSGLAIIHRNVIVTLAARHKLPAVYFERFFVAAGGSSSRLVSASHLVASAHGSLWHFGDIARSQVDFR